MKFSIRSLSIYLLLFCASLSSDPVLLDKIQFKFAKNPIDVVIPCTAKDIETLELCIKGIRENCKGIRRIIVVSKERLTKKAAWYNETKYPFKIHDVAMELFGTPEAALQYMQTPGNRLGWIYQQLLKFYAPFVIPKISSNVLFVDSDTIFLNPVSFIGKNRAGLFNVGNEYHPPYFGHAKRLLTCLDKVFPEQSGICHHMLMQRAVLKNLFQDVKNQHKIPLWKAFLRCIDHEDLFGSGASEFEIYFNYAFIKSDQFVIRPLRWQNVPSLENMMDYKNKGYHYISCHSYMRETPPPPAL